jgi:hypothetical protein
VVALPNERVLLNQPVKKWHGSVIDRLNELVRLERGWDGYRGAPISFENAHFALCMLDAVCGFDAPVPEIVPGTDGDLQVEWHTHDTDIELHVHAPNDVIAWRTTALTRPDGEEIALRNDFSDVAAWIREITEPSSGTVPAAA